MSAHVPRLSFDFRSREQVAEFIELGTPESSVFIPTLQAVTLGRLIELDLGLTGQRERYQLEARAKWFRRGGSGRLLPGVSLACDAVAAVTLQQLVRDTKFHSFLFTRSNPRFPCAASVRVHLRGKARDKGGHPLAAHLGDLSRGGAFVVLPSFPQLLRDPEGPPVLLELAVDHPARERPVVALAVRWLGFLNGQRGFGGQFVEPDARVRAEVQRLLKLAAGALPER